MIVGDVFGRVKSKEDFREGVRKDIRDVGNLLFLMLTGYAPKAEGDKESILEKANVMKRVRDIVLKAMDMDNGYESSEEMLQELRNLVVTDERQFRIHFVRALPWIVFLMMFSAGGLSVYAGRRPYCAGGST